MIKDFLMMWMLDIKIFLSNTFFIIFFYFANSKEEYSYLQIFLLPFALVIPIILYSIKTRKLDHLSKNILILSFLKTIITLYVLRSILSFLFINFIALDDFSYELYMLCFDIGYSLIWLLSVLLNPEIFLKITQINFLNFIKVMLFTIFKNAFQCIFVALVISLNLFLIIKYSIFFSLFWFIGIVPLVIIWTQKHVKNPLSVINRN